jgi:hypothetical protein
MRFSNQIGRPKPPGQAIRPRGRLRQARQDRVLGPQLPPSIRLCTDATDNAVQSNIVNAGYGK